MKAIIKTVQICQTKLIFFLFQQYFKIIFQSKYILGCSQGLSLGEQDHGYLDFPFLDVYSTFLTKSMYS